MKNYFLGIILFSALCKDSCSKFQHSTSLNLLSNSIDPIDSAKGTSIKNYINDDYKGQNPTSFEQCSVEILSRFLSIEGVNFLINEIANYEGVTTRDILERLAKLHGLHVHKSAYPRDLRRLNPSASEPAGDAVFLARKDYENDEAKDGAENLVNFIPDPWTAEANDEELAPNNLPRALLLLQGETGGIILRKWVDLAPKTSLLDAMKAAEMDHTGKGREIPNPPLFNFKLKRLKSKGCVGIATIGPLRGTPLHPLKFTVFTATLEVEWDNPCLPKASDLLIYPGYVILVSPSRD